MSLETDLDFPKRYALIILITACLSACRVTAADITKSLAEPTGTLRVKNEFLIPATTGDLIKSPALKDEHTSESTSTPIKPLRTSSPASSKSSSTPSPNPLKPICNAAKGHIQNESLKTDLLRYPLEFRVYLPECYYVDTDHRYPVLYLFHGQGFKDDQWDRIGADETADQLIAQGEIPPIIIVMPYERSGGQPSESQFGAAFVGELVPFIDRTYRTIPDREHRAVGGLSRGGGWAIHFGLKFYATFGALGGHSPAVFFSDAEEMRSILDGIPATQIPRIYLDIGERDRPEILRAAFWFEKLLDENSIAHEWHLFTGYHNEEYWKAHMAQYLRWYAQNW